MPVCSLLSFSYAKGKVWVTNQAADTWYGYTLTTGAF